MGQPSVEEEDVTLAPVEGRIGSVLAGKWTLERLLGVGGTAAVFAATHRNGYPCTIKILHPHLSRRPTVRARFLREARVANRVAGNRAVRVVDDGDFGDETFLVLERVEGETLRVRADKRGGVLPWREAVEIGCALLEILVEAHGVGVVHRDVKPENVLLAEDGTVRLLDFGLAHLADGGDGTHLTVSGVSIGTPAYLSPEQASGATRDVDARSDIFSTGATLFNILTGRFLHEAENVRGMLVAAATQPAPSVRSFCQTLPAGVAAVIDRSLSFRKTNRFETAAAMLEALRDAMTGVGPEATPTTPPEAVITLAESACEPTLARSPEGEPEDVRKGPPERRARGRVRWPVVSALLGASLLALVVSVPLIKRLSGVSTQGPLATSVAPPPAERGLTTTGAPVEVAPVAAASPSASVSSVSPVVQPSADAGASIVAPRRPIPITTATVQDPPLTATAAPVVSTAIPAVSSTSSDLERLLDQRR